jgi:hypothetical protein
MGERNDNPSDLGRIYEIRVAVCLDAGWARQLEGFTVSHSERGETLLTGVVADQAALHGLLKRIRDLGIPLVAVNPARLAEEQDEGERHET